MMFSSAIRKEKIPIGILGASGAVGSRFLNLLQGHPWFDIVAIGGGPHEVGKRYGDVAEKIYSFYDPLGVPANVADKKVIAADAAAWKDAGVRLVFSAVPRPVAQEQEQKYADAGIPVFSNVVINRMREKVPLLQPYINPDHIMLATQQESYKKSGGFIATNPNCSTIMMTVGLKPLLDSFGLQSVMATTLQGISGSGYPGLGHTDMYDNCVPYIGDEEGKMESESRKVMGKLTDSGIEHNTFNVSAICNRVPVSNGHSICISAKLERPPSSIEEIKDAYRNFQAAEAVRDLPSCPKVPIRFFEDTHPDRPQHRLDREYCRGMGVNVGRVRPCNLFDVKFTTLGHNTIVGAAGGSIINAELAVKRGLIK